MNLILDNGRELEVELTMITETKSINCK